MGLTINLNTPTLGFGAFGIASCTVEVTNAGTPVSTQAFWFPVTQFSSECDSENANTASVHFGAHTVNISNGTYTSFSLDGTPQASIYALVNAFSNVVADLS